MSNVLNYWINSSYNAIPCEMWKVEEIQQLQALLFIAKESEFDNIYQETQDNRRLRNHILEVIFKDIHIIRGLLLSKSDLTAIFCKNFCMSTRPYSYFRKGKLVFKPNFDIIEAVIVTTLSNFVYLFSTSQ